VRCKRLIPRRHNRPFQPFQNQLFCRTRQRPPTGKGI
jgi:hypothetical protein